MNKFESRNNFVQRIKDSYPPGTRLLLLHMNDPHSPVPCGTRGKVDYVDDAAQIHMRWDNGRTLAVVPGEDSFRKLTDEELAEENKSMDEDNSPVLEM